jgi:hypothetical protein
VNGQNAGIIFTGQDESVLVEVFELSPTNEAVMSVVGRLRRQFPAKATSIPRRVFDESDFKVSLARTIAKMSIEEVSSSKSKIQKASDEHIEERDTTDPSIVTDLLFPYLSTLGKTIQPSCIWKNTREEVMYMGGMTPWRRPPFWLLIRVTLQLFFSRQGYPNTLYKEFLIFFMARTLSTSVSINLASDGLYCMIAKISRRLLKLDLDNAPWLEEVDASLSDAKYAIDTRWTAIIRDSTFHPDLQSLSKMQYQQDIATELPQLDKFIRGSKTRQKIVNRKPFDGASLRVKFEPLELPCLEDIENDHGLVFALLSFEKWVEESLEAWLEVHIHQAETCGELGRATISYHQAASQNYLNNPESQSVMLLSVLELWVACDKSACSMHESLIYYDPGVPHELLQSLLLRPRQQMKRLNRVEVYCEDRRKRAVATNPSVFYSYGAQYSFATVYYENSHTLQSLRRDIEEQAYGKREKKRKEFHKLKADYNRLMLMHGELNCNPQWREDRRTGRRVDDHTYCTKCGYYTKASLIDIGVHEWPLPENELQAQSTIFELGIPPTFSDWRDATIYITIDVFKSVYPRSSEEVTAWNLGGYLPDFYEKAKRRVILSSSTKPNVATHRNPKPISTATVEDVILNNGLKYHYYDTQEDCYVTKFDTTEEVALSCTHVLSENCSLLQEFLFRPYHSPNGLTPNEVISRQSDCPDQLALDEYKPMASLPTGYRLQWLNILRQLYIQAVDLGRADTVLMIMQISDQAGPPLENVVLRASHCEFGNGNYCTMLLEGLNLALMRISTNWKSYLTVLVLASLATRLLSLTQTRTVAAGCFKFLSKCRSAAVDWIRQVQSEQMDAQDDQQRDELNLRIFEIALVCVRTFDVDGCHVRVLLQETHEAAILLECAIRVHNLLPRCSQVDNNLHVLMVQVWQRLMHRCYSTFWTEIVDKQSSCIDAAIAQNWPAFVGGSQWAPDPGASHNWVTTKIADQDGEDSLIVHFDLLSGQLLVDGLPLARLPFKFEARLEYQALFGRSVLEVTKSNMPGMSFSSVKDFQGYSIHLGFDEAADDEFLLLACTSEEKLELVPAHVFESKMPQHFVCEYTHWFDHSLGTIEFRPKQDPWKCTSTNWTLERFGEAWTLRRNGTALVNHESDTARQLHRILNPLENEFYIHILLEITQRKLDIELPRLRLGFSLSNGSTKLLSQQFRGMHLDPDQHVGTLIGLRSKLILRDDRNQRKLIVPDGRVNWLRRNGHVDVVVQHGTSSKVYVYDIDAILGRLTDNGSLQSGLTRCYLHALTSYCAPDTLIGSTGTEESLTVLGSAAVRSFDCLTHKDIELLYLIAKMSPGRFYYPSGMQVMESVSWDEDLSFLSQHIGFDIAVKSLLNQGQKTKLFYPKRYVEVRRPVRVNDKLAKRHCIRAAVFYLADFGAENHTSSHDTTYIPRDNTTRLERANRVFEISTVTHEKRQSLPANINGHFAEYVLTFLRDDEEVVGPVKPMQASDFWYSKEWLMETDSVLRRYWCRIHSTLSATKHEINQYDITLCFAAMAYSASEDYEAVQILATAISRAGLKAIWVPQVDSFRLKEGYVFDATVAQKVIKSNLLLFDQCPEASLQRNFEEDWESFYQRRLETLENRQRDAERDLLENLRSQWICEAPQIPHNSLNTYIDVQSSLDDLRDRWKSWYQNNLFYQYLQQISLNLHDCPVIIVAIPAQVERMREPRADSVLRRYIKEQDMFCDSGPLISEVIKHHDGLEPIYVLDAPVHNDSANFIERLSLKASHAYAVKYVQELQAGHEKLRASNRPQILTQYLSDCQDRVVALYKCLKLALVHTSTIPSTSDIGKRFLSPRVSIIFLVKQLSRARWKSHSREWKAAIVMFGQALTNLQQAQRMLRCCNDDAELKKELTNSGHNNWSPMDHPEVLLLEIESGMMMREVQAEIAAQMRAPPDSKNSVMQLDMGEGKTSFILPCVASHAADGERLARIFVAKPQANELRRTLIRRLGGLLNHQIYLMPFSRSLNIDFSDARIIAEMYKTCTKTCGVMLVQPEHVLSFELMALERLIAGRIEIGNVLLEVDTFSNLHIQWALKPRSISPPNAGRSLSGSSPSLLLR